MSSTSRSTLQIVRLPVGAVRQPERLDAAVRAGASASASALSAPRSSSPRRGTRFTKPLERQADGGEVRVDVGVVELDVVDDGDVGQVLQELRRLVEERAVVFVAFDDELAAAADPVAALEVLGDAADEARSGRRRRASAPIRSATSSSSCRGCRRSRSTGRPTGNGRAPLRAASSSGSCGRAPPRARGCRARWRCRRRPGRGRRRCAPADSPASVVMPCCCRKSLIGG